MILGTIGGALLGAFCFFAVGLQRYAIGDSPVIALGWAVGALLGFLVGGRLVDALIGAPRLTPAHAEGVAEPAETDVPAVPPAPDARGTLVDLAIDDTARPGDSAAPALAKAA